MPQSVSRSFHISFRLINVSLGLPKPVSSPVRRKLSSFSCKSPELTVFDRRPGGSNLRGERRTGNLRFDCVEIPRNFFSYDVTCGISGKFKTKEKRRKQAAAEGTWAPPKGRVRKAPARSPASPSDGSASPVKKRMRSVLSDASLKEIDEILGALDSE